MMLFRARTHVVAATVAAGLLFHQPAIARDHDDHDDGNKAAAVVAGVAIAGALAIAASKKKHKDHSWDRYDRDDRHYYRHNWGATFRPPGTDHVICYRRTKQCYKRGHYSSKWTHREFGYYGR